MITEAASLDEGIRMAWGPIRRHGHGMMLRGQFDDNLLGYLTSAALKDLNRQYLSGPGHGTLTPGAVLEQAEKDTRQFRVDFMAIMHVPLAPGTTARDRVALGVSEYLRWCRLIIDALDQLNPDWRRDGGLRRFWGAI